jgi:hypothetical protein
VRFGPPRPLQAIAVSDERVVGAQSSTRRRCLQIRKHRERALSRRPLPGSAENQTSLISPREAAGGTFSYDPLANDDGSSPTDGVTSDATLTGQVTFANLLNADSTAATAATVGNALSGVPSGAPASVAFLTVQFDTNGDGTPDASTTTGAGGTFSFKPTGLTAGQVTVLARAIGRESNLDYGDRTSLTFTYQPAAAGAEKV